jgi:hypothetical protein
MAKRISELPAAGAVADGDELELNQAGTSRKATRGQIVAGLAAAAHGHTLAEVTDAGALAAKDVVGEADIASAAVTTGKLADLSVEREKLALDAVATDQLADDAVTGPKIADGAVTTTKIAATAVGAGQIANGAVINAKIADGAVTTAKIGVGAVTAAQLASNAVTENCLMNAWSILVDNFRPSLGGGERRRAVGPPDQAASAPDPTAGRGLGGYAPPGRVRGRRPLREHGLSTPLADERISGSPGGAGAPYAGSSAAPAARSRGSSPCGRTTRCGLTRAPRRRPVRIRGAEVAICPCEHQLSSPVSLTTLPGSQDTAAVLSAASIVDPFRVTPLPAKVMAAVPMLWTTTWVPAFSA